MPLWALWAAPAMLAGHAASYLLAGTSAADGRHGWFIPGLETSTILLAAVCAGLLARATLRGGSGRAVCTSASLFALWPRLALLQLVLFYAVENIEGYSLTVLGVITQIVAALVCSYLIVLFRRAVARCAAGSVAAARYLERLFTEPVSFVARRPTTRRRAALFASAGPHLFQRPPPLSFA